MSEHLTQKQIEDYCRQQLDIAELLPVSDHLGECEACRLRIECAMNADAAFLALRSEIFGETAVISSPHLSAEQTVGYVDRNLPGEELQMIGDHLTHCEQCALAVDDLNTFKNDAAPSLEREYNPAASASQTRGLWYKMIASLPALFQRSPRLAFGAVAMILLLAATGWWIWRTTREKAPEQEIAVSPAPQPQPEAPRTEPAPAPAPLLAQLNDGDRQLTLDQEGRLSGADDLPPAYQSMMREALATRRVEMSSQLSGLGRPSSPLMGADNQGGEFTVIEPVGIVLMIDQPTFRWSPMQGATVYVVEVYDSKFNLVASSPELTRSSWKAPQLARGKVYGWQVKAIKDGQEFKSPSPPAPQARFRVLDKAKANELAKAERDYPSSHLALGLLYAEAGLLKEAEQELRMLEKANPDSDVARSLLRQLQALRRRSK